MAVLTQWPIQTQPTFGTQWGAHPATVPPFSPPWANGDAHMGQGLLLLTLPRQSRFPSTLFEIKMCLRWKLLSKIEAFYLSLVQNTDCMETFNLESI